MAFLEGKDSKVQIHMANI